MSPFTLSLEDGVAYLTLDTPACDVNIFSRQAAAQLLELLSTLDPQRTRAVVFRSAKERSFINGVGLLMAGAARTMEDVKRLGASVREAYRVVRELPMPTISAIAGSCFGCGVEFALQCRYRVAANTHATQFYMTEIADYLFVPAFGATQDLPRVVGLADSADLLLWGERWTAARALASNLVDACFDDETFAEQTRAFVSDVVAGRVKPRPAALRAGDGALVIETRERIGALPSECQPAFSACFDLMIRRPLSEPATAADYEAELEESGRTVTMPVSKAALSFFFIRQLAEQVCRRGYVAPSAYRVVGSDGSIPRFLTSLAEKKLRRISVGDEAPQAGSDAMTLAFGDYHAPARKDPFDGAAAIVAHRACLSLELEQAAPRWSDETVVTIPFFDIGIPFAEIATREGPTDAAKGLFDLLSRAGYVAILTKPKDQFVTTALTRAFTDPALRWIATGGSPDDHDASLRDFGFMNRCKLIAGLTSQGEGRAAASALVGADFRRGSASATIAPAMVLSLVASAVSIVSNRIAAHPSIVDLFAREVLDFPLAKGSLLRFATPSFVAAALASGEVAAHLPTASVATLGEYARAGKTFY